VRIVINNSPDYAYAEWQPGARTINLFNHRGIEVDCCSFGYDKPDNSTTKQEMLRVLEQWLDYANDYASA
jgi:hypothetical protein